ncbi:Glutaredoxin-C9 [Stylosanthes scabra]|uniref:Glutaredoxin-C9 n=1 Tax=Stylosanthes scabra TaxID=79078 RepID=A0ABU6X3U9_9FABA|nr:Glutaredoxin-C9 [Stylosanthes scabra]
MQVEASASASSAAVTVKAFEMVQQMASSNAVVVFSCSDCCMSTVVKRLLFSLGVGPTIVELDEHASGEAMEAALYQLSGTLQAVPAVFVGGKFLGGVQTLMASHINGSLIPLLKEAGALWL